MKDRRLIHPLEPRPIGKTAWFYETRKGLDVVQEYIDPSKGKLGTCMVMIPWKHLIAAVKNHQRILRARKRNKP
jgi:hypothetical protein